MVDPSVPDPNWICLRTFWERRSPTDPPSNTKLNWSQIGKRTKKCRTSSSKERSCGPLCRKRWQPARAGRQEAPWPRPRRSGGDIDERGELFAVSIKLADFWSEDPESWFDRADNQFITRGIKEDATKFSHAVQALSYSQHKEAKALI